ncbi:RlmE family RNA methyltransferase [Ascoidea rubescens DSM 1968]|uniref:rRNA methyltransferase 2, mitochondrial n=1 Tax=Ascoidea rubescens DSM 1968 TaxID=1344418 RepID=A0A1D2VPU7_9ASCO|nr:23S ribosomal RNA methyltransferase [Ascoidea rubescens DSM 1968]ODV63631.1 23S ribosomal RNA methyltransferase [Ascoidea rubescens DSM 1968]
MSTIYSRSISSYSFLSKNFVRNYNSNKSSSSTRWINRAKNDYYAKQAQKNDYRSRAAFKLEQINDKFRFFQKGQNVVDLGFAPGAWSQVAALKTSNGRILGVDILPCSPPPNVSAVQGDILSQRTHKAIRDFFSNFGNSSTKQVQTTDHKTASEQSRESMVGYPIDVVLSDMMANTSGIPFKDHLNSMELCEAALVVAIDLLKPNGTFVCKFFSGKEDQVLEKRFRKVFKTVQRFKPEACRSESKELYFVCLKKRNAEFNKTEIFQSTDK